MVSITWSESEAPRLRTWMAPSTRWFIALLHKLETPPAAEGSGGEIPARAVSAQHGGGASREVQEKGRENSGATYTRRDPAPANEPLTHPSVCPPPSVSACPASTWGVFHKPSSNQEDVGAADERCNASKCTQDKNKALWFLSPAWRDSCAFPVRGSVRVPQRHPAFTTWIQKVPHSSALFQQTKPPFLLPTYKEYVFLTYAFTIFFRTNWFIPLPGPLHQANWND